MANGPSSYPRNHVPTRESTGFATDEGRLSHDVHRFGGGGVHGDRGENELQHRTGRGIVGLTVRTESRRSGPPVTIIEGEVDSDQLVVSLSGLIIELAADRRLTLDVSRLEGLSDEQLAAVTDRISAHVDVINRR